MSPASVNSGGAASLVRLDGIAQAEVPSHLSATAATALSYWQARPGMIVTVLDADRNMWRGRLVELHTTGGLFIPFHQLLRTPESPLQITVYQALPEKERFELILEKLTELGVTRIVPIVSRHSTTPAMRDAKQHKSHRWPEVLRRAAVQCRRSIIPELGPCLDLATALLDAENADLRLMLYEGEGTSAIKESLVVNALQHVALLVGPEGGFSPEEVKLARLHGFLPVTLGPRILRTETAAISAATVIQFALGDLN